MQMKVNSPDLIKLSLDLAKSPTRITNNCFKWVEKFTDHAYTKMKHYSKSKRRSDSSRGSGKLSNSIQKQIIKTTAYIKGVSYVPSEVKYQHAAEYGFKIRKEGAINARGSYMKFHYSNWQKATRSSTIKKLADKNGYFHFQKVDRGVYKGLDYALKAFASLQNYYSSHMKQISDSIAHAILITVNVGWK